ncbi:hypothetical protein GCM10028819_52010 [Spirosoma humi]
MNALMQLNTNKNRLLKRAYKTGITAINIANTAHPTAMSLDLGNSKEQNK